MSKAFEEAYEAWDDNNTSRLSVFRAGWNAALEAAAKLLDEKDYGDLAHDLRHSLPAEEK